MDYSQSKKAMRMQNIAPDISRTAQEADSSVLQESCSTRRGTFNGGGSSNELGGVSVCVDPRS